MSMRYFNFMYWRSVSRKGDLSHMIRGRYPKRHGNQFTRRSYTQRKQTKRQYAREAAFEIGISNKPK